MVECEPLKDQNTTFVPSTTIHSPGQRAGQQCGDMNSAVIFKQWSLLLFWYRN